ncbi:reverse transcriptase [Gossypium australe]|uniref:Reverse transcriptase n=1 Tax=Gossypium australe TaxID=47621 RepID=A0A5B6X4R3_9ROSI|nr:reverse transcriptase [Gossypium australe]
MELILTLSGYSKPYEVYTDASDYAIRGVLMQDGHLITFESRSIEYKSGSANTVANAFSQKMEFAAIN